MDLKALFNGLTDKRDINKIVYSFEYLMLTAMCAIMAGEDSFSGIEEYVNINQDLFGDYLDLPEHPPTHDTYRRLFDYLAPEEFENWFRLFTQSIEKFAESNSKKDTQKHIAIDGKSIRNSKSPDHKNLHLVSAWASHTRLVLCQQKVDEKSNEITAIPLLLEMLDLENAVVTLDAMGCQRDICEKILDKNGDYIISVKENQKQLYEEVLRHFREEAALGAATFEHNDKAHGRIEQRRCTIICDIERIDWQKWPGLKTIVRISSSVIIKGQERKEDRYYLSSLTVNAAGHLDIIRSHWGIENSLHWVLDCTFNEDKASIRRENAAINLSVARKLAVNIFQTIKSDKESLKYMQRKCQRPKNAFSFLIKFYHA